MRLSARFAIFFLVLLCLNGPVAASIFDRAVNYLAGPANRGVAVGDINGDGKLDLVVASLGSNSPSSIDLLLGNGDGTFQRPLHYAYGTRPAAVALGDFNGDGKLDIAFGSLHPTNLEILLNNGDGTFQMPISYEIGPTVTSIVAADFNHDGITDLAVAFQGSIPRFGGVVVFLGNGDGTLLPQPRILQSDVSPMFVAVGDVNQDGNLDLVFSIGGSTAVVEALGNGNGTFQPTTLIALTSFPDGVALADFNHDGNLDIVAANCGSLNVSVFLGNGNGTFQGPFDYSTNGGAFAVTTGDFNQDGSIDLAVTDDDFRSDDNFHVTVLLGDGAGGFTIENTYVVGRGPYAIAAADFNGDGALDLVTANSTLRGEPTSNTVSVLLNAGGGH